MNRREFLIAQAAAAAMWQQARAAGAAVLPQRTNAFAAPANIQAAIDAARRGEPISPLVFGGYMEPATTRVWAELLTDRKFADPIVEAAGTPAPAGGFMGRFRGEPFRPVGPAGTVTMDTVRPFVGAHSPRVTLVGSEPR